jgi:hypothetical protein
VSATTRLSDYAKSHLSAEELQEKKDYFIQQLKSEELTARQKAFIVERLNACNYLLENKENN